MATPMHSLAVLLGAAAVLPLGLAGWAHAEEDGYTATVRVNLQEKKTPVSPTLYGIFIEEINYHAKPVRAEIQLDGAAQVGAAGRHIVIRSAEPYAENSLDNPRRIVPEEQPLAGCGERCSVTLAPYSVNVLRIPASEK
jgi:alpha-L-arabinofuranosidase